MSTIPVTVNLDSALIEQARERAKLASWTLSRLIESTLSEWVEAHAAQDGRYVVRAGDSLAQIAVRFYGNARLYTVIAKVNGVTDPRLLRVGQVLRIPSLGMPSSGPEVPPPPQGEVEFIQSPHYDSRPPGTAIWAIVVHATANSSLGGVISWFRDPVSEVSAHYNIGKDGRVVQMVRDEQRAWHAGQSAWKGVLDVNDFSIGIELVNKNDGQDPYPDAQYRALVALCKRLVARYEHRIGDIVGHKDISLSGRDDPVGFDLERLRRDVAT